jgi:hypothetical protein
MPPFVTAPALWAWLGTDRYVDGVVPPWDECGRLFRLPKSSFGIMLWLPNEDLKPDALFSDLYPNPVLSALPKSALVWVEFHD